MARPVCVVVILDPPPIPTTAFDWCAFEDGMEERTLYGYGATRAAAVADLFVQLEDE